MSCLSGVLLRGVPLHVKANGSRGIHITMLTSFALKSLNETNLILTICSLWSQVVLVHCRYNIVCVVNESWVKWCIVYSRHVIAVIIKHRYLLRTNHSLNLITIKILMVLNHQRMLL